MSIMRRVRTRLTLRNPFRQIIGRTVSILDDNRLGGSWWSRLRLWNFRKTVDETVPDYEFWDKLRRGKQPGFELSGLLLRPAAEITSSWILGDDVKVHFEGEDEYTTDITSRFMRRIQSEFTQLTVDWLSLGDQYIIVNSDGSISIPSPDTVFPIQNPIDYRHPFGYIIRTRLEKATIEDEYRVGGRLLKITNISTDPLETVYGSVEPRQTLEVPFENLTGVLPITHFANERTANETNGRSMFDSLYLNLSWYDDVLTKALAGVNRLSNPILAFFKLLDAQATKDANSENVGEEYPDEDGNVKQRNEMDLEAHNAVLFIEDGGDVKFVGPDSGFTNDARNMLKSLYLLFSEHLSLPDVVMGFELSSSRASAGEQIKTFFASIKRRRLMLEGKGGDSMLGTTPEGGLLQVIDIWLRTRALIDLKVKVMPAILKWPELAERDEKLKQDWTFGAYDRGVLTDVTLVEATRLVEDPATEVEKATEENQDKQQAFDREVDDAINRIDAETDNTDNKLDEISDDAA